MSAQRATMTVAGFFALLSLYLAYTYNGLATGIDMTKPNWLWFTIFVGANLFQSGFTGWCLMTNMLRKVGFK